MSSMHVKNTEHVQFGKQGMDSFCVRSTVLGSKVAPKHDGESVDANYLIVEVLG